MEAVGTNEEPASPTDTAEKTTNDKRDFGAQAAADKTIESPVVESTTPSEPAKREIAGMKYKVYENGDVGYRFNDIQSRVFGGDAFRDRGSKVTIEDSSDRAIKAAIGYAKEKWGDTPVTLNVNPEQRDRVIREAAKAGLNIKNPEFQRDIQQAREKQTKDIFAKAPARESARIKERVGSRER